ncbi:MAG: hypothetical protein DRJ44_01080 [Thermoprotei archaeon]|nr:MAG: hypothetical protein DRJ44_01080 [Thermoprotei archaeon]
MMGAVVIDVVDLIALYIAGLQAIFQPCIYPMIPVFFSYVMSAARKKAWRGISMLLFILGLYTSFAIYGLAAAFSADFVSRYLTLTIDVATLFTGLLMFSFGLVMFTPLREIFTRIRLPKVKPKSKGLVNAFLVGFIMAIVAAPCAGGSILMALIIILKQSSYTGSILTALIGMGVFSLGLASPLVILGIFAGKISEIHGRISKSFIVRRGEEMLGIVLIAFSFISVNSLGLPSLTIEFINEALTVATLFSSIIVIHVSLTAFKAFRVLGEKTYALLFVGFALIGLDNILLVFEKIALIPPLPPLILLVFKIISYSSILTAFTHILVENKRKIPSVLILWNNIIGAMLSAFVVAELLVLKLKYKRKVFPLVAYFVLLMAMPLLQEFFNPVIIEGVSLDFLIRAFSGFALLPLLFKSRDAIRGMTLLAEV